MKIDGQCHCGEITYEAELDLEKVAICHCTDCQKQSGSAFGMSLIIQRDALEILTGEVATFETTADSKRLKTCAFCPRCGVRIYNGTRALFSIKAGTLDDTSQLIPDAHYWTRSKQSWTTLPADTHCYETFE